MGSRDTVSSSTAEDKQAQRPRRLRTACDPCHFGKLRCSGGKPCSNCRFSPKRCEYAYTNTIGRPKGAKNKKSQMACQSQSQNAPPVELISVIAPSSHHSSNAASHDRITSSVSFEQVCDQRNNSYADDKHGRNQHAHSDSSSDSERILNIPSTVLSGLSHSDLDVETSLLAPEDAPQGHPAVVPAAVPQNDMIGDAYGLPQTAGFEYGGESAILQASAGTMPQSSMMDLPSLDASDFLPGSDAYHSAPGSIIGFGASGNESGPSSVDRDGSCDGSFVLSLPTTCPCRCLQSFAELTNRLRHMREKQLGSRLDVRINAAEETLEIWDRFLHCPGCQNDTTGGTLLLAAVTLKNTLRLLQQSEYTTGTNTPSERPIPCLTPFDSPPNGFETAPEAYAPAWSQMELDEMPITIGGYRIRGQGRQMIANSITSHAMEKIDAAVTALKERSSKLIRLSNNAKEQARMEAEGHYLSDKDSGYLGDRLTKIERQDTIHMIDQIVSVLIVEM